MKNLYVKFLGLLCHSRGWYRGYRQFCKVVDSGIPKDGDVVTVNVRLNVVMPCNGVEIAQEHLIIRVPREGVCQERR